MSYPYRSATHPHIGLKIPYKLENRRNISPICFVDSPNCLKCGSSVGSKNAQVLETITITRPVIIIDGIVKSLKMDAVFDPDTYSRRNINLYHIRDYINIYFYLVRFYVNWKLKSLNYCLIIKGTHWYIFINYITHAWINYTRHSHSRESV